MTRSGLCARPGCGDPQAAWLTYDYSGQQVWLDDAAGVGGGNRWALCAGHAERLRVPRGWMFQDRRIGLRPGARAHDLRGGPQCLDDRGGRGDGNELPALAL